MRNEYNALLSFRGKFFSPDARPEGKNLHYKKYISKGSRKNYTLNQIFGNPRQVWQRRQQQHSQYTQHFSVFSQKNERRVALVLRVL